MDLFDEYVRSLLHYYLNFYSAFSADRGRKQGELESIICSDLARCGVIGNIHEVKTSIDRETARHPGFLKRHEDRLWLEFRQAAGVAALAKNENWEDKIRGSKFAKRVPSARIDKLIRRAKKLRKTVEEHLIKDDSLQFLDAYGIDLFACLEQVLNNNRPECIDPNVYRHLSANGSRENIERFRLKDGDTSLLAVYDACADIDEFMGGSLG